MTKPSSTTLAPLKSVGISKCIFAALFAQRPKCVIEEMAFGVGNVIMANMVSVLALWVPKHFGVVGEVSRENPNCRQGLSSYD